jgi:transposase-like protein
MSKRPTAPKTLQEAIRYFSDPDTCLAFMVEIRWPAGVACPTCQSKDVRFLATRRLWECKAKHPKRQFSAKVGTIFEDSALGLDKWFAAMWLIANAKNGISSYEVSRSLKVTQKTAWFMLHRIRLAMQAGFVKKMAGRVEADETFIGPAAHNMHVDRRKAAEAGRALGSRYVSKAIVAGILERKGRVHAQVVQDTTQASLMRPIYRQVATGAELITDAAPAYRLPAGFIHSVIDKSKAYVRGHVHTNGMENFWSLLKRMIRGTYVSVESFHLGRYLDEEVFRFNERKDPQGDSGRFLAVLQSVMGRRLTYAALTT